MAFTDRSLGIEVHYMLKSKGIETPMAYGYAPGADNKENITNAWQRLYDGVGEFMEHRGLDTSDDSLCDTPRRVADMFTYELFAGLDYGNFPACTAVTNKMKYNQVVISKGIETLSVCEHHWQTIDGLTHIGYIPGKKVLGLSKFSRITDFFARRPQVQERMTEQIHAALCFILDTEDVIVVQNCTHYCMKARGVRQGQATTITSKLSGRFMTNEALRKEFFDDIR